MSDVNLATKSDLASLFQELEDAAKHAKIENKENKIKTESQVKELDSFLTSVQEVVKVIDEDYTHYPTQVDPKKDKSDGWIAGDPTQPIEFDGSDTKSILDKANKEVEKERKVKVKPFVEVADIETPVVETKSLSLEDEDKLGAFAGLMSSFGAILDAPPEVDDTDTLKLQVEDIYPTPKPVISEEEENNKLEALQNLFSNLVEKPRIPRKKGQPAGSDSHSDLYTDENPKGTIQGLGFKDVATAKASVSKIEGSSKTHAHKIQAAVAMEQRAKEMGKTAEAAIYRSYIEKMKKKTKEMQKEEVVTPNLVTAVKDTPLDITQALTEVKSRALPTKEQTVEATQQLISNVVNNLDDMKGKTEVKEQIDEIDALRKEFNALQLKVRRSEMQVGGLSGSGGGLDPNKIANHMIPAADDTFDLGSATKQWKNLYLSGSTLIVDGTSIDSGELTVLDGITAGTVSASKAVIADSNKDVSGFRNVTIAGDLTVQGDTTTLNSFVETETPSQIYEASTITILVTVATKDSSHPYYGVGSSNGYKLNGTFSPFLKLIPRSTYKFDQSDSSNSGHPLRFYYDAAKTTAYTTGVTTSGTPGSSGAYTQIVADEDTPDILYYQCSSHAHMGFGVFFATRNFTGFTTDNLTEGSTNKYASAETVQDIVGAMVTSNTETDIAVTYEDSDGTLDFVINGISGNAATATALATARTIHGVSFDGTANIDLTEVIEDTVGAMVSGNTETGITVTYQDGDGTYDFALAAAQTTITSLLATDIKIGEDDETKIDFETADEIHFYAANAHQVKVVDGAIVPATDNDIDLGTSGVEFKNAFFDGTVTSDAFAGPLTGDVTGNADTATALATARNIGGVSFDGTSDVNLPGVNTAGDQNTTGNAATATSATASDTVKTVTDGTNANFFLTFVSDNNGSATAEAIKTDAGLQYNPSTDTLSVTNITATIDGVSSAINVADESSDTTCFPVFVTSASGNLAAKSGTNLSFNSSSGALTATSFTDENGNAMTTAASALSDATAISVALG